MLRCAALAHRANVARGSAVGGYVREGLVLHPQRIWAPCSRRAHGPNSHAAREGEERLRVLIATGRVAVEKGFHVIQDGRAIVALVTIRPPAARVLVRVVAALVRIVAALIRDVTTLYDWLCPFLYFWS